MLHCHSNLSIALIHVTKQLSRHIGIPCPTWRKGEQEVSPRVSKHFVLLEIEAHTMLGIRSRTRGVGRRLQKRWDTTCIEKPREKADSKNNVSIHTEWLGLRPASQPSAVAGQWLDGSFLNSILHLQIPQSWCNEFNTVWASPLI